MKQRKTRCDIAQTGQLGRAFRNFTWSDKDFKQLTLYTMTTGVLPIPFRSGQAILIDDFDESEAAKAKLLSDARLQTAKDSP